MPEELKSGELEKRMIKFFEFQNKRKVNGGLLAQWQTEYNMQSPLTDPDAFKNPFSDKNFKKNETLQETTRAKLNQEKVEREKKEAEDLKKEKKAILKRFRSKSPKPIRPLHPLSPSHVVSDDKMVDVFKIKTDKTGTDVHIQVRFLDGSVDRTIFNSMMPLSKVCEYVISRKKKDPEYQKGITLALTYPKKTFTVKELDSLTLEKAGLCPRAALNVIQQDDGWEIKKEDLTMFYDLISIPEHRLRGDTEKEKRRFRKEMREREIKEKLADRAANKKDLKRIRQQVKADKLARKKKYQKTEDKTSPESKTPSIQGDISVLQIRLPNGKSTKLTMTKNQTLSDVRRALISENSIERSLDFSFVVPFPRKEFPSSKFPKTTMISAGLIPRAVLVVNAPDFQMDDE